jgi:IS30 family transposase
LQLVEDLLNDRPRKTLGYRTPNEFFLNNDLLHFEVESA